MFEVLIIDDTKSVQAFVKAILAKAKEINVQSAFDGTEAVEIIRQGRKFDLIFLDWEMPILNGPETFKTLRQMGVETPVIMMTTKNSSEDIQMMLEAGVAEYMMKPFTTDILFEKIEFVTGKEFQHED
jgi:two-component system chemotaxis response regulator CheY